MRRHQTGGCALHWCTVALVVSLCFAAGFAAAHSQSSGAQQQSTGLLGTLSRAGAGTLSRPAGFLRRLLVKPVAAVSAELEEEEEEADEEGLDEEEDDLGEDDSLGMTQQGEGEEDDEATLPLKPLSKSVATAAKAAAANKVAAANKAAAVAPVKKSAAAAALPKKAAKEKLFKGVTEDTPLWDEDDALDEAEKKTAAGKPAAKQAAAAKKVPAATGAVIPSAKKAKAKAQAAKNSEEATKAVAKKAAAAAKKKTTDIVADTKVQDLPKYPGPAGRGEEDEEDDEERANMLPAEQHWEREALISTKSCKIYVLDISEMAHFLGYPKCDVNRFVTDPEFGTILPNATHLLPKFNSTPPMEQYNNMYPFHSLPHHESLNAAPWYVYQTLLRSDRRVDEPDKADIIFVYDYCRLMWALSEEHAEHHWWASENLKKKLTGTGGPALVSAYNVMTQMMQWKRSGGKEFVFFQSHPGFAFGNENVTKEFYDKIMCREMGDALHVVVERGQRWKCPTYREENIVIAPYSGTEHLTDMVHAISNISTPRPSERPKLAFFRGNCGPWEQVAKRMRHALVGALRQGNSSEIDACCLGEPKAQSLKCTKEEAHGGGTAQGWHRAMLESMAQSRFCMIIPGDSQSSDRLSDAFVTGCIPVFVGPPFHAMPFGGHVDYAASSVFINLTDTRKWFGKEKAQWHLNPRILDKHKGKEGDWWHPKWWKADTMSGQAVTLKNMEQVVFYLKQMAPEEADEKYENVMQQRHMFIYKTEPSNPPSASDIIIDSMCEYALAGYGGTALNEYEDLDVKQERDRKRKVAAAKAAKAAKET